MQQVLNLFHLFALFVLLLEQPSDIASLASLEGDINRVTIQEPQSR